MESSAKHENFEDFSVLLSSDDEEEHVKVEEADHDAIEEAEINAMQIQSM